MDKIVTITDSVWNSNELNNKIAEKVKKNETSSPHYEEVARNHEKIYNRIVGFQEVSYQIGELRKMCEVKDFPIETRFRFFKWPILMYKKVTMRLFRWIFHGYITQQNNFNKQMISALETINNLQVYLCEREDNF